LGSRAAFRRQAAGTVLSLPPSPSRRHAADAVLSPLLHPSVVKRQTLSSRFSNIIWHSRKLYTSLEYIHRFYFRKYIYRACAAIAGLKSKYLRLHNTPLGCLRSHRHELCHCIDDVTQQNMCDPITSLSGGHFLTI
jgi:hypothetical protein